MATSWQTYPSTYFTPQGMQSQNDQYLQFSRARSSSSLQPSVTAQSLPSPRTPGSLSPLPASHNELRQRLEAAGVPPEQIAAVLLQPSTPTVASPLPSPTLPPRPPSDKITYKIRFSGSTASGEYIISCPDLSSSYPSYTACFYPGKTMRRKAQLHMYRHEPQQPQQQWSRTTANMIGHCTYHHVNSQEVEIKHQWMTWDKWEPEHQQWASDVGTISGATMQWTYDYREPVYRDEFVIRCASNGDTEICKVVLEQLNNGRIELPRAIFGHCTAHQLDEMLSNAMIQAVRKWAQYTSSDMQHTKDARQGKSSGFGEALATANNVLGILNVLSGGGGGS